MSRCFFLLLLPVSLRRSYIDNGRERALEILAERKGELFAAKTEPAEGKSLFFFARTEGFVGIGGGKADEANAGTRCKAWEEHECTY